MTFQSAKRFAKIWQNVIQNVFQKVNMQSGKRISHQRLGGNYVTSYCLQGYLHGGSLFTTLASKRTSEDKSSILSPRTRLLLPPNRPLGRKIIP